MMKNMRRGIPNLFKDGTEHLTGLEQAVLKNCKASKELQEITRTSLGPNGMNKLIINHLERIFVTSDCATIIKEMEIQHPAAKMVVMAANMQEAEVGDGSNFVVCLAGELLHQAEALVRMGLHPSEIVAGYNKAAKKALEILETLSVWTVEGKDMNSKEQLIKGIWSAISSKQYGNEEFIANLVADACLTVMPKDKGTFAVDNVRVVKVLGGSLQQSEVIKGMAIPHDTIGSIKRVKDAKVAVFNSSLQAPEIETKAVVEITSAEQLVNYNLGEEKEIEKQIRAIAESGVKVVVTGGTVDDMAAHFLEKFGLMTLKVTSKFDLRRLAKACKARHMVSVGAVPPSYQGFCSNVFVKEVGGKKVTIFQQDKMDSTSVATIMLRSSTENNLNDLERAVDDGVNTVRAMGRDGRFCAGAGAVDIELARQLAAHSHKSPGLDQYSIKKFAEALEVVPRTLAENAGLVPTDVIAGLYAAHEQGQTTAGISVDDGKITDMAKARSIYDLLLTKQQAIKLAADAAVTVLRVDQIIQAKPAGGPKIPGKNANWDDD